MTDQTPVPPTASGEAPQATGILCRFGEIFLKQGNRDMFEEHLRANLRRALADLPGLDIRTPYGRVFIALRDDAPAGTLDEALRRLSRVFGLVSVSPVSSPAANPEDIGRAAVAEARAAVAADPALGRSFKVISRRADKTFPLTSYQLSAEIGAVVNRTLGIPVNVRDPALTIGVEIGVRERNGPAAYVFARHLACPGGLPVGSAGRALLLLSGGIDSPVAAWLAAKRGLALDAVYFHSPPFVGEKTRDKVIALARRLAEWQVLDRLFIVPFTDVQKRLREGGKPELAVVLYRRMMMRIADRLADRTSAGALVTGENLSQVASQTVANLTTIEDAARHLVLRPLLTFDKVETIRMAEQIGTYDLSTLPFDDCCSLFVPRHPATGARVSDAERSEAGLDVQAEADTAALAAEELAL